jgi:hypothetical protein
MVAVSAVTIVIVAVFAVLGFVGIMMTAGLRFHRRRKTPWSGRGYQDPTGEP